MTDRKQLIAKARRWILFINSLDDRATLSEREAQEIIEGLLIELEAGRSD